MSSRTLLALVIPLALAAGCRRSPLEEASEGSAPPPVALTRCNAGMLKAVELPTLPEVLKHYYQECAELYTKAPCSDAWRTAAGLDTPTKQLALVSEECRKAYCPELAGRSLALCSTDFEPTPSAIEAGWGLFLGAVIEREGGEYAPHLLPTLLGFYARTKQLEASLAPPPGEAPAASASAGAKAPSGSASPPPGSAGAPAAPASSAAPKASAAVVP